MQIPQRKSELNRKYAGDGDNFLSAEAIAALQDELRRLERSLPAATEELNRTRDMGDLSENAAYQEAKRRLFGMNGRMLAVKEKLKNAVVIEPGTDELGHVRIGSTVEVSFGGRDKTYVITGSQETDPAAGRISHLSPLGALLLGRRAGDEVKLSATGTVYLIRQVS
ncbi:MAG: GreA/GreB family elongation factor [Patescibacteria group bacterium]|jgi:transcription elongation factor GreA